MKKDILNGEKCHQPKMGQKGLPRSSMLRL
jgi:hypothetical protein